MVWYQGKWNYLAKIDREESRDAAVERRTAELMTIDGGYSPAEMGNFAEAISELAANERYTSSLALMVDRVGKAFQRNRRDCELID